MQNISLFNYKWQVAQNVEREVSFLTQTCFFSDTLAKLLIQRGVKNPTDAMDFLESKISKNMPDPMHLLDMDLAAQRVVKAILSKQKITIFGDYDVDGATSSALIKTFLTDVGHKNVDIYIPDRIKEGYGPSAQALKKIKDDGSNLVITVDCGTVAFEALEAAFEYGLEVIVVDHHCGVKEKPKCVAVVNPNREDETSELKYLAGVGVSFMLITEVNRRLKNCEYFLKNKIEQPKLIEYTYLVAIGTICDIVPLIGLNRSFVKRGLEVLNIRRGEVVGLAALIEASGLKSSKKIGCTEVGFVIGPRINAGGRIGDASLGAKLLCCKPENKDEAVEIAQQLESFNLKRKEIQESAVKEALAALEKDEGENEKGQSNCNVMVLSKEDVVVLASKHWHEGIIGIIAARIKDKLRLPTVIVSIEEDGLIGKASCRSVNWFNVGAAVNECVQEGLLIKGGGHKMAAGFSVDMSVIGKLTESLKGKAKCGTPKSAEEILEIDCCVSANHIQENIFDEIEQLAPFGSCNSRPVLMLQNLKLRSFKVMGAQKNCVKIDFYCQSAKKVVKATAFNLYDNTLQSFLEKHSTSNYNVAGTLNKNTWNGSETFELHLIDLRV